MMQRIFLSLALITSCANPLVEICDDSVDNDFDGLIDCSDDNCSALPSCDDVEDCNIPGDEDGNGQSDCEDVACTIHPLCTPEFNCGDGVDNDADGLVDCSDEDCIASPICGNVLCGDGFINAGEECDGDNLNGFDCLSLGFQDGVLLCSDGCSFDASSCISFVFCGDGFLGAGEQCDDGNNVNGDGCSSFCELEFSDCGDGLLTQDEQCDDGNLVNGDGCDEFCLIENFFEEVEPNEDGTPQPNGNDLEGNDFDANGIAVQNALSNGSIFLGANIRASISPAGDEDVFAITNANQFPVLFSAETFTDAALTACPNADTVINVRNEFSEILTFNDDDGQEFCSLVENFPLEPGQTLFIQVLAFDDINEIPQYSLQVRFQ
jgi:cysteine-rich repeat protein